MDIHDGKVGITLRKVDAKGSVRLLSISREGATLVQRVSAGGKAAKETRKKCADDSSASREYGKILRTKMRDGYVFLNEKEDVKRGQVVFACFAAGGGGGAVLDLAPDGRSLLTAGHSGAPTSVWVEQVDTQTGARKTVFEKSHKQQLFLHSTLFVGDGSEILIALDDETLAVTLATGDSRRVAAFREGRSANFNPHVLRPQCGHDRSRLVLFDAGSIVRVVDQKFHTLLEVPTDSLTTECRATAISPSGRLLAVYRVSRGIVYSHDDAKKDTTCEVELWDIDKKKKIDTWKMAQQVDKMAFDAADKLLLVTWDYASGPVAFDLGTGKEVYSVEEQGQRGQLASTRHWTFSPDNQWLVLAGNQAELRDSSTRKPAKIEPGGYRSYLAVFSGDGSLFASHEDNLAVLRRVLPAPREPDTALSLPQGRAHPQRSGLPRGAPREDKPGDRSRSAALAGRVQAVRFLEGQGPAVSP